MTSSYRRGVMQRGMWRPFRGAFGTRSAARDADLEVLDAGTGDREETVPEVRLQEPQLRRPRRIVHLDDEARAIETQRLHVHRDDLPDGLGPAAEHAADV